MKNYKSQFIIFFAASLLLVGCNSKNPKTYTGLMYEIDFEQCLSTEQQMFLSEIADTVEYIELKTPDDIVIANIINVISYNDFMLLRHREGVSLFHKDGRFIRNVGAKGQGPGEYVVSTAIAIDTKRKEILVYSNKKLLYYDFEGVFLRSIEHTLYFTRLIGISDSIIWLVGEYATNDEKYKAFAIPSNGRFDTLAFIPNENYGVAISGRQVRSGSPMTKFSYQYNDDLYFKGNEYNDIIWKLSGLNSIPYTYINMGKYKMPVEYQSWFSEDEHKMNSDRYRGVSNIQEDDNFFYLISRSYKFQESTTRLGRYVDLAYMIFDKKTKKGFTVKDRNGIGLTDDILGGPPVWPRWISDDCYYNAIEVFDLLEVINDGEYKPAPQLKDLLSRINEDTNQLLIMFRKKNSK